MTNAEMAKQTKEFNERLDRCRYEQDKHFVKYDADIKHLNEKTKSIEQRLDSMSDATTYVRQVAEESKKIEDALKVTTRKLELISQKNVELMERNKGLSKQNVQLQEDIKAANKMCDNVSKKASKLADRVQKLETAQKQLRLDIISTYGIPEKAKTIESMYPCLWKCGHKGKECDGLAQECPIAISECNKVNRAALAAWLKNKSEETPKTAKWVEEDDGSYHCSACGWRSGTYWTECPACRAKMKTVTRDYGEEDGNYYCDAYDGLKYFLNEYDNYMEHTVRKSVCGDISIRYSRPKKDVERKMLEYNLTEIAAWFKHKSESEHKYDFSEDFKFLNKISWDIGTMGQESFTEKTGERIRDIVEKLKQVLDVEEE